VNFSLKDSALKPLLSSFVMSATLLVLRRLLPTSLASIGIMIAVGAVTYFSVMFVLVGETLVLDTKKTLKTILNK
jgi:hypothetical protein